MLCKPVDDWRISKPASPDCQDCFSMQIPENSSFIVQGKKSFSPNKCSNVVCV